MSRIPLFEMPYVELTAEQEALAHEVYMGDADSTQKREIKRIGKSFGVHERSVEQTARALLVLECEGMILEAVHARDGSKGIKDDLAAECRVGVLKALDAYVPGGEARFMTYARMYIAGSITDAEAALRYGIALPRKTSLLANKVHHEDIEDLDDAEIARGEDALAMVYSVDSINEPAKVDDWDGFELEEEDVVDHAASFEDGLLSRLEASGRIDAVLGQLSEAHREIISIKYFGNREATDEEVGLILGVHQTSATRMLITARTQLISLL